MSTPSGERHLDDRGVDDHPGAGLWIGLALGAPVMAYGAIELVRHSSLRRAFDVAAFAGGGVVVHDLVVAPLVVAAVWLVGRLVPPPLRTPVRAGILGSALVVALAWPPLAGYGDRADNATVHPLDYTTAVLTVLAALWIAVACWGAIAALRARRSRGGSR
ncbi:MAG TPA: hypothetical protein VFC99_19480 [Acidimicrobiia bacterium]|nr:hypothetical protein [Acidimicrobiia bacterium]